MAQTASRVAAASARNSGKQDLWRIALWGSAAAAAVLLAAYATSTQNGRDRIKLAATQWRGLIDPSAPKPAPPLDAKEGLRLAEAMRVLVRDRDRLVTKIATLERTIDDITRSVARVEKTAQAAAAAVPAMPKPIGAFASASPATIGPPKVAVPKTAPPATGQPTIKMPTPTPAPEQAALPPTDPPAAAALLTSAPSITEAETEDLTSSINLGAVPIPWASTVMPTEAAGSHDRTRPGYGLDLGGASTVDALRRLWTTAQRRHAAQLDGLHPIVRLREHRRSGAPDLRLIAGPLPNAATAAWLCTAITSTGAICQPAVYDGQRLAVRRPPRHSGAMARPLFLPTPRQIAWLAAIALGALACGYVLRYRVIEQEGVGIDCGTGVGTWLCSSRSTAIALFTPQVFGLVSLGAALLNLIRPHVVLCTIALIAGGFGIILYNVALSAFAVALLILSLARPAPEQG